jgi:hypothetical protein
VVTHVDVRQYPIGLLYDQFQVTGLWTLRLHIGNFPSEMMPRFDTMDDGYNYYISMLKEADQIRNGSIKIMMALSTADVSRLWESIANGTRN